MPTNVAAAERPSPSLFSLIWESVGLFFDRVAIREASNGSVEPFGL